MFLASDNIWTYQQQNLTSPEKVGQTSNCNISLVFASIVHQSLHPDFQESDGLAPGAKRDDGSTGGSLEYSQR